VGQAIVALLKTAGSASEFGSAEVKLFHARDFQKGLEEGVSVYLYRVTVSGARRNMPPTQSPTGKPYRQPLPVDLYYLITPWAKTAEMQHLILAWSMRTIEDSPSFPSALLNSYVPDSFRPEEGVDLIHDTVSVQDMSYIWEAGKPNIQDLLGLFGRKLDYAFSMCQLYERGYKKAVDLWIRARRLWTGGGRRMSALHNSMLQGGAAHHPPTGA